MNKKLVSRWLHVWVLVEIVLWPKANLQDEFKLIRHLGLVAVLLDVRIYQYKHEFL